MCHPVKIDLEWLVLVKRKHSSILYTPNGENSMVTTSEYTTFQGLSLYCHNVQDTEKESGKD